MRNLENISNEQAQATGWKIIVPFESEVVGKATYEDEERTIMKSTKRLKVPGGWLYNTSTEICRKIDTSTTIAEALAFIPDLTAK